MKIADKKTYAVSALSAGVGLLVIILGMVGFSIEMFSSAVASQMALGGLSLIAGGGIGGGLAHKGEKARVELRVNEQNNADRQRLTNDKIDDLFVLVRGLRSENSDKK